MKPRFNYFKSPDLDSNHGRHILFYCEWGDPKNTNIIVCVHGLTRNSRDFDYLANSLSDKYRVICVDIVGRGKSEWLSNKSLYDYETYITDIITLLDHLDIRKIDWVGTSMGGIIGMIIASRYPHIIRKLVLNDIGPIIPGNAIERIVTYAQSIREFHNKIDAEQALRYKMATFGVHKEEHWRHLMKHSVIKKLNGKYTFSYDPDIIPTPKLVSKLKIMINKIIPSKKKSIFTNVNLFDIWNKISCPILAIRGMESDVLTAEIATKMQSSKKNIKIIELEGIGHAPMLMEDEQIAIISTWLLKKKNKKKALKV